ncbi:AsmA family protein [Photobacterium alginatilyticum]|uniref:AsmA family protein n=1 Tax=Photobacterium alginatilyticum TaxID=1775171 RepID=A0ABW9YCD0_9GAMM|nr:AsmA family protein [Photobacterium alginatilyticum]NBI51420.1 AsmA family protein [Photobacterium alginatilyticum]
MKKLLYAVLAIVVVIVVGIGALLALVDPNQFKPLITEQVKKATGRDLVISGDIGWRFFPSIGFTLGQTEFRNPQGFAEPNLVQLGSAELSVSVVPLFSRHLEIGHVSLQDGRVFIQTRKDGVSNLDGLGQPATQEQQAETTPSQPATASETGTASEPAPSSQDTTQPWTISLEGVELVNASAEIRDEQAGTFTSISALNLTLNRFAPGEWTQLDFDVAGQNGELAFTANGATELFIVPALNNAELKNLQLTATAKDPVNDIQSLSLAVDKFKAGDWSAVTFAAKGEVPDLVFDAKGETRLKLSEAFDLVQLQALALESGLKGAALPRPEMAVKLNADAKYDVSKGMATLSQFKADVDELSVNGEGSFKAADIPVIRFAINSDNIDLDSFLGLDKKEATQKTGDEGTGTTTAGSTPQTAPAADKNQEPDLSALKGLDVAGTVKLGKFKAANAKLANVLVDMKVAKGVLKLKQFNADLYDGSITMQATLNANGKLPTYKVTNQIRGVQVQPLMIDVADNDVLAGKGDITMSLAGTGLAEKRIRENIAGTVDIHFADGAIYGVNVPEMIREAKAKLKGKRAEYVKEERKTDFSAMVATIKLGSGKASTSNLDLDSPLLRIAGKGHTNLVSEAIDFKVNTSVVATSKGQGGKQVDEVADLTVPIDVKGNWTEPKFSMDLAGLLKQNNELEKKAQKEVERGLEKLLGDKAEDDEVKKVADKLLKGLFN